jgi:DNA-binding beta-propeller fold protein YncE
VTGPRGVKTIASSWAVWSAVAGLIALAVAGTGCSAAPRPAAPTASHGATPAPVAPTGLVTDSLPGCTTAVQPARTLTARTSSVRVPLNPFGIVATGPWAFVSLSGANAIGVYRIVAGSGAALVRQVSVPGTPLGEVITPDGRYLLAADSGAGAFVIDIAAAEQGRPDAVLGDMTDSAGTGALSVTVSPDGNYAFVSLEDSGEVAVFNLRQALAGGLGTAGYVGSIPVGPTPTNMTFSPDGEWAYATTEGVALNATGNLEVINVHMAETRPAAAVVASVPAGCNPVRVITSATGTVVWVSARASDAVLAFSAALLQTDPAHALLSAVRVGEAPVQLALVRAGRVLVVADSNRFIVRGAVASLAVVDVPAALARRPALLGYLPAGMFPRELALVAGGRTLLVTNFNSDQLESVDIAGLPGP